MGNLVNGGQVKGFQNFCSREKKLKLKSLWIIHNIQLPSPPSQPPKKQIPHPPTSATFHPYSISHPHNLIPIKPLSSPPPPPLSSPNLPFFRPHSAPLPQPTPPLPSHLLAEKSPLDKISSSPSQAPASFAATEERERLWGGCAG